MPSLRCFNGGASFGGAEPPKAFKNVAEQWPGVWVLKNIKLAAEDGTVGVEIQQAELRKLMPKPLVLEFQ